MIHIAICDDQKEQLLFLEQLILQWANEQEIPVDVRAFENAQQYLFHWEEKKDTDILLLDIDMPGMDGLALAKKLRLEGAGVQILFVTGLAEHALEGYEVEAVTYLLKPIQKERLFSGLTKAWSRSQVSDEMLLIQSAGECSRVRCRDICFLESAGHDTLVHLYEKGSARVIRSKVGIHTLEKEIEEKSSAFIHVHRSYFVHLGHIAWINRKEAGMLDGSRIPIARGKWEPLNQAYLRFCRKEAICSDL